jgi:hypothetical protein
MRPIRLALLMLSLGVSPALAQNVTVLTPDKPTPIGDLVAVCTGAGLDARQNPAWAAYPLKIEVAGKGGQYLGDIRLTFSSKSGAVAMMSCDGPWILVKVAPGAYHVDVETEGQTVGSNANVPVEGQGRIIIRFPMLGGEVGSPTEPHQPSAEPVPPVGN